MKKLLLLIVFFSSSLYGTVNVNRGNGTYTVHPDGSFDCQADMCTFDEETSESEPESE